MPNFSTWGNHMPQAPSIRLIAQVHGHKAVGHGGGINGFSTVIWLAIEEDAV